MTTSEECSKAYEGPVGLKVEWTPDGYAVTSACFNLTEVNDESLGVIRAFPKLRRLSLMETWQITPKGLYHLEGVPYLEELDLCDSSAARDEGMAYVGALTALRVLSLNANHFGDAGLAHLSMLHHLESLDLHYCEITDIGARHLSGLTRLRWLNLSQSFITDAGLKHLLPLTELEELWLWETYVTDAGIAELNKLPKLRFLELHQSRITAHGVSRIRPDIEVSWSPGPPAERGWTTPSWTR